MIAAVVFDLDGVLLDSERVWDLARREVAARYGGHWTAGATAEMQGMSSREWAGYMRNELGVHLELDRIIELVLEQLLAQYQHNLPLFPGAIAAVSRMAARWPLGLASSSNRVVIDRALSMAGLADAFVVTVSSEEVAHGKPAPDVYLEAARLLGRAPSECVAIEDSGNGIRSAASAQMKVLAVPNREFPPPEDALANADLVLGNLNELMVATVERLGISGIRKL